LHIEWLSAEPRPGKPAATRREEASSTRACFAELALGATGTVEGELRWLVVGEKGAQRFSSAGSLRAALDTGGDKAMRSALIGPKAEAFG